MTNPFSVETVFVTILGYPLSYIEFVGTILYLWSVWLLTRRKMLTWPIGIASVILYLLLFYQIRLYSDAIEQVYYFVASIYGWWYWSQSPVERQRGVRVSFSAPASIIVAAFATIVIALLLGETMRHVHEWVPAVFPEPASYPHLDALTTVMSFTAMWLTARRRIESWVYWIIVDVIGIGLYYAKDVKFISLLYCALLVLAVRGFFAWQKNDVPSAERPVCGVSTTIQSGLSD